MSSYASKKYQGILTCDEDISKILRKQASLLKPSEWEIAKEVAKKLIYYRENILRGGAGLAASQIGLNYPVFIYTTDRTSASLRVVINPSYKPVGDAIVEREEACYSVPLRCTKVKRYATIRVKYQDLEGQVVEEVLEGFAAQVFQHEMDHLNGKLTIDHPTARILTFSDPKAFEEYMKQVHLGDSTRYRR